MTTYIFVGLSAFAAGVVAGVILLLVVVNNGDGFSRRNRPKASLNRFNFDKQKKYEKEGRKFPFSY